VLAVESREGAWRRTGVDRLDQNRPACARETIAPPMLISAPSSNCSSSRNVASSAVRVSVIETP
jgi:hypothetical protein